MSKNTQTWRIKYLLPTRDTKKLIAASYYDYSKSRHIYLLRDGKTVERPLVAGEELMVIYLSEETQQMYKNPDGRVENKRFVYKDMEVAIDKKDETTKQRINRCLVDFLKNHYEVSWKSLDGKEQNNNIPQNGKVYYELENLDAKEAEMAEHEALCNELIAEVLEIKANPTDLSNLAFGLGINPVGLGDDKIFNLIKTVVRKDPKAFHEFLHGDSDKYYKIVLNKALKTAKPNGFNYIVEDLSGNYRVNDELVASNYAKLILYFKEFPQMFEYLEVELGFKKKEPQLASTKSEVETEVEMELPVGEKQWLETPTLDEPIADEAPKKRGPKPRSNQ